MNKIKHLMTCLLIYFAFHSNAEGQTLELTIDNQHVEGTNFYFDIMMKATVGDVYLGGADLVLTFNSGNFTSPTTAINDIPSYGFTFISLKNSLNAATSTNYEDYVSPFEITSNEIIINVSGPTPGNVGSFNNSVAKLLNGNLYQFGTYMISGMSNINGKMGLAWKTSGDGSKTKVSTIANSSPWGQTEVTLLTPAVIDQPLPVELTSFSAMSKGRNVVLNWKTATEINSSSFEVERNDGKTWSKVSDVKASGTSNAPKEYSYVDMIKSAVSGNISYRLKMIDNDGKYEYSTIAEVKIVPTVYSLEQNYPNPFNPETKIQYSLPMDAKVSLKVYDMVGREVASIVNEQQAAGYYEQKFGGYNFSSGVYFYRIVAEAGGKIAFTSIKKMVMIK